MEFSNYGVFVGKPSEPTGYRWIEEIKDYREIPKEQVYLYLTPRPIAFTDVQGRVHVCDLSQLVLFNKDNYTSTMSGRLYKMADAHYRAVAG